MSRIKGQNFRLLVAGAAVPEETNVSITIQGNTDDSSTKDSAGFYSQETVVSTSWQAQVDTYDAEPASIQALVTTFNAAQPVTVGWDQTAGAQNRVAQNAAFSRSGSALLTDVTFTFNDRATVSVSSQYQGTGALS